MSMVTKFLFLVGDLVFLNISILISFFIAPSAPSSSMTGDKVYLLIFSNLAWFFLVMVSNPYNVTKGWSASKMVKSQLAFIFIHLLIVASLIFFFKRTYSVLQISLIYGLFVTSFFSWKVVTYYFRKVFTPSMLTKNFILVGKNAASLEIRKHYLMNPQLGYRFLGYFEFGFEATLLDEIRRFCVKQEVHEIYCCPNEVTDVTLRQLVDFGLDSLIKIRIVVNSPNRNQQSIHFDSADRQLGSDMSIISLDETRNQFIKRIFDVLFSSVFLVLIMSWLLPIVSIFIKFDSKGPIFFRQLRSGESNKPFWCFKFRTMIVNQESDSKQATKDDPRITKLGQFLRQSSIDELPQFINVFIGNMSVVGPRPHMLKHTEEYSKLIEKFLGRHYVKPGITGLAQCMGYRGETRDLSDMENRVRLDRYYIENWTFWLDIKIIFLTVVSLIRGSDKAF
jgi:putative colanic acid biosysnthesis UDP-glucose lipid carrier transferase